MFVYYGVAPLELDLLIVELSLRARIRLSLDFIDSKFSTNDALKKL